MTHVLKLTECEYKTSFSVLHFFCQKWNSSTFRTPQTTKMAHAFFPSEKPPLIDHPQSVLQPRVLQDQESSINTKPSTKSRHKCLESSSPMLVLPMAREVQLVDRHDTTRVDESPAREDKAKSLLAKESCGHGWDIFHGTWCPHFHRISVWRRIQR